MADGTFCEYTGQMDNALMSQMSGYGTRGTSENLGDGQSQQSKAGPGFYTEQFPSGMSSAMMESLVMSNMMSGNHGNQEALIASMMSQAAAASSAYENAVNFALKPEKGLPPTPPGSPDDPKGVQAHSAQQSSYHSNMHPASMVGMPSSFNHNLLAKPVPMRRLSDKRITQPRSGMGGEPPGMMDHEAPLPDPVTNPTLARALAAVNQGQKRPRSEKKAIPDDAKDDKYFERRKRNNNAAKKSRDARKAREDEIAIRASFLEKENAILRAQVTTLREEANSLRQLLLQKRASRH
ncbi:hepatic leukemia factor-like isoform X2 [Ruditapes philippinarum]|uniref:hepatic leukemia factor-like isoform X2 n=1 Tax=Ruditapes philippinarum TaxID=129788 RepID=UPI00295A8461|nr:hepatic leukemia factor-like isoform X2 [Ruditapes philippinarum]